MPLGDSITEITCWRALLWDGLVSAGVASQIQFVGSQTDNTQNCVANDPNWDHHHEGHSGFLAINIANTNLVGWLASAKPDVVQFMLGTNDVAQGHSTTEILAAYTKMVQEMRASNPNMKIIVSTHRPNYQQDRHEMSIFTYLKHLSQHFWLECLQPSVLTIACHHKRTERRSRS